MSWNRLDSTEGSLSILLLTCIPCSGLLQFQHSISNTQKTYADSRQKLQPPCWEIKNTHTDTRTHGWRFCSMCSSQNRSLSFKTDKSFCGEKEVAAYVLKEKSANCLQEKGLHWACNEGLVPQRTMTWVNVMPFDLQVLLLTPAPKKFQGCLCLQIPSRCSVSVAASHFKNVHSFHKSCWTAWLSTHKAVARTDRNCN